MVCKAIWANILIFYTIIKVNKNEFYKKKKEYIQFK